jgi:hypothetical protein
LPAAGIYPVDACSAYIAKDSWKAAFEPPEVFDVDGEIEFIRTLAESKQIVALGECGN